MEFKRDYYLKKLINYKNVNLIKIVTGPRRVGKSYLLNTLFYRHLINEGIDSSNIIKFSFDNDDDVDKLDKYVPNEKTRIKNNKQYLINSKKFRLYIKENIKTNDKYYLLLDEIQLLEHFVGTLNSFLNNTNMDVYVTGSNSFMLSSDIVTEFRGRSIAVNLLPLTFKEYYEELEMTKEEAWKQYVLYGGMPIVALLKDDKDKEKYLRELCEETYVKDIIQHHSVRKKLELQELLNIVASSIGSLVSSGKLSNSFLSLAKVTLSRDMIEKYIKYFRDAFLVKIAKKYNIKGKKHINAPYKIYFNDIGVRNARLDFKQIEETHIMENIIYNELMYRGYDVDVGQIDVYVDTNKKDVNNHSQYALKSLEIDFIANKNDKRIYIQSAYDISDDIKREKELNPLLQVRDSYKKVIITKNLIKNYIDENGILFLDLFDFLLDNYNID